MSWRRGWWGWGWKVVIFKAGEAYDDGCHPVYSPGVVYVPSDNLPFLLSLCWLGSIFVGSVCTFRLRVCFSFYLKCTFRFFVTSILFHLGHLLCLESSFWGLCVLISLACCCFCYEEDRNLLSFCARFSFPYFVHSLLVSFCLLFFIYFPFFCFFSVSLTGGSIIPKVQSSIDSNVTCFWWKVFFCLVF